MAAPGRRLEKSGHFLRGGSFAAREPARRSRTPQTRKAVGRRFAGRRPPASPTARVCRTGGTARRARTSCGARRFPGSRIPARSSGDDRIFVTSAVSSDPSATFRPGLYGDGDASKDRSRQRWMIYALDKRTGKILWERVAHEGDADREAPHQVHLRQLHARDRRPRRRGVVRIARRLRLRRQRAACSGRSTSAGSTWARTTSRLTSGARPARPSSGTTWSSCSATRRPIRSCWRWMPRPGRRSGRPSATSCRRGARRPWRRRQQDPNW